MPEPSEYRSIQSDCCHYIGDRPCRPHKEEGITCETCSSYEPVETRILIVKLGALGDVVRTTSLVASFEAAYPGAHLTWLTGPESREYLEALPSIDRVLPLDAGSLEILHAERFDVLACLELSDEATALAVNIDAEKRLGFGRDKRGVVFAFDPRGERILAMSHWDDLKRANRETYQALMEEVLGLPHENHPIPDPTDHDVVSDVEARLGAFFEAARRPLVGLNLGGGGRWQKKVWTVEGFAALSERVLQDIEGTPFLLYGSEDRARAEDILGRTGYPAADEQLVRYQPGHPFDSGGGYSVREFAALISRCDVLVTADSLGLHLSLAVGTPVVCLVGPTSAAELELYGLGRILQGEVDCLGCYRTACDLETDCMNTISVDRVFAAIQEELGQ